MMVTAGGVTKVHVYTYDDSGNMTADGTYTYDYNTITKYVYDGDHCIADYDAGGNLRRKYIYGPSVDEPISMIEASGSYAGTYYYHFDALGSVVALTSGNAGSMGNTVEVYEYDVYGRVGATDANHPNRFMFTGREFDKDTGLYYYRARYYNPEIGRFLQIDPIGYANGINWYMYCGNNPLIYVDPFGLDWFDSFANFWAGAADSLSFGATGAVRKVVGVDKAVDRHSTSYVVGEWTEVGIEVVATAGSATMKYAAKKAAREAAEAAGKATISAGQDIVRAAGDKFLPKAPEGAIRHHSNPLFGHPGSRRETIFPTGGLPPETFSGSWNIDIVTDRAAHMAAHARLQLFEDLLRLGFNPGMIAARGARDYLSDIGYFDLLAELLSEGDYMTDGAGVK